MNRAIFLCLLLLCLLSGCGEDQDTANSWEHSATGLFAAAVSNDGRFAVVSSSNEGASFWDLDSNARLFDWKHGNGDGDPIALVAFSPNDSHVLTADSRSFVIWDARQGHALGYWGVDADINAVALSNDARFVLLGLTDGRAIHIDQLTQRRVEVIAHQGERVAAVDLSADGSIAVTGGNDGRVMVWRASDAAELHVFEHSARITVVKLAPDRKHLFSADERGDSAIRNLATGAREAAIDLPSRQNVISAAQFSKDGNRLLLGFPGRYVRLWDRRQGKLLRTWRTPDRKNGWVPQGSTVYAVAFNDANATIVAESSNGLGRAWHARAVN